MGSESLCIHVNLEHQPGRMRLVLYAFDYVRNDNRSISLSDFAFVHPWLKSLHRFDYLFLLLLARRLCPEAIGFQYLSDAVSLLTKLSLASSSALVFRSWKI